METGGNGRKGDTVGENILMYEMKLRVRTWKGYKIRDE